jgi:hypothetical protein
VTTISRFDTAKYAYDQLRTVDGELYTRADGWRISPSSNAIEVPMGPHWCVSRDVVFADGFVSNMVVCVAWESVAGVECVQVTS